MIETEESVTTRIKSKTIVNFHVSVEIIYQCFFAAIRSPLALAFIYEIDGKLVITLFVLNFLKIQTASIIVGIE